MNLSHRAQFQNNYGYLCLPASSLTNRLSLLGTDPLRFKKNSNNQI